MQITAASINLTSRLSDWLLVKKLWERCIDFTDNLQNNSKNGFLRILNHTCRVAAAAVDILVADIANLFSLPAVLLSMAEQHIRRVTQVMADSIVAESLTMTLVTILFFVLADGLVSDSPAKTGMACGCCADDHRRFHKKVIAAAHDRNGMA